MIDLDATLRAFLAAQPVLVALCATRIVVGTDLPAGYRPAEGAALLLTNQGGQPNATGSVRTVIYRAECYAATPTTAYALDRALFAVLENAAFGAVRRALQGSMGRLMVTPTTAWPVVVSSYHLVCSF